MDKTEKLAVALIFLNRLFISSLTEVHFRSGTQFSVERSKSSSLYGHNLERELSVRSSFLIGTLNSGEPQPKALIPRVVV